MKTAIIMTFILAAGCSKDPENPSIHTKSVALSPQVRLVLEATERFDAVTVSQAVAATLNANQPLTSASAERCWRIETSRPDLAKACLLAWSIGGERSAVLEEALARLAPHNRTAAIAAIRSETPLALLAVGELQELLRSLSGDPVWLRARAVMVWLRNHPGPRILDVEEIERLATVSQPRSPADFRFLYLALRSLNPTAAATLLQDHCNPLVTDDLRLRCWRFLSAFVEPGTGEGMPANFEPWLPSGDRSWQLFRVSLPSRARLLGRYVNR